MSKLVRDRIPDLIRAEGTEPVVTVDRSAGPLLAKLREEVAELEAAPDRACELDELADVFEAFRTLVARLRGDGGLGEVVRHARSKRERRGGFDAGWILHPDPPEVPGTGSFLIDSMTIAELHHEAMEEFDAGREHGAKGNPRFAANHYHRAFELEREAARRLGPRIGFEPTRSVIHRSAATMAARCGEFAEARRLVAEGLAGDPRPEIAAELREILVDVERRDG